eukprot:2101828-Rhodomonas_salina.1
MAMSARSAMTSQKPLAESTPSSTLRSSSDENILPMSRLSSGPASSASISPFRTTSSFTSSFGWPLPYSSCRHSTASSVS